MTEEGFRRYLLAKQEQAGGQTKLAGLMGEHRPTLAMIISGRRKPTEKVLAYLGLEPAYEFVRPKLPEHE